MVPTIPLIMLFFAFSAAAKPVLANRSPLTLPISRRVNFSTIHNLVHHDQKRVRSHKLKGFASARFGNRKAIRETIENQGTFYTASIGIGIPATTYSLIVDTGSSNTWIGAGKPYQITESSTQTSNKAVDYGEASFSGTEFTDTISIEPFLVLSNQSIGIASVAAGFKIGIDGILGLGPVDLTVGTLSPAVCNTIPTVTDNLASIGLLESNSISISFEPIIQNGALNGEIAWGRICFTDPSRFTGSITFIPLTTTLPASQFWGINQSIHYGGSTSILATTAGIIDTGSTLILLATDGFNKYKTATGSVLDTNTGLLRLTPAQFPSLQSLFFIAGGTTFELTANAQIFPRSLNADIGGVASFAYLIVNDIGFNSGQGLDFVLGYAFTERFYTVLDTGGKRIGLATTPFTNATTN